MIFWEINLSDIFMILLTLSYVITTITILHSSKKQFQETMRPKVHVDFKFKNEQMYVLVKNYGERSARKIKIKFTPDIKYKIRNERALNTTPLIENLPFLSPKNELDSLLGMDFHILPAYESQNIIAEVNYESEKGVKYQEKQTFSLAVYSKRIYTEVKDVNDIVSELKNISKSITGIKCQ